MILLLFCPQTLPAQWYVNYEHGLNELVHERYEQAIEYFNKAISNRSNPSANAKTYGLNFIDYFPYLYRGIANYNLDQFDMAQKDLERSKSWGAISKAYRDKRASARLQDYLSKLKQNESLIDQTLSEAHKLYNQGQFDDALNLLFALLKEPGHLTTKKEIEVRTFVALIYLGKEDSEKAIEELTIVVVSLTIVIYLMQQCSRQNFLSYTKKHANEPQKKTPPQRKFLSLHSSLI